MITIGKEPEVPYEFVDRMLGHLSDGQQAMKFQNMEERYVLSSLLAIRPVQVGTYLHVKCMTRCASGALKLGDYSDAHAYMMDATHCMLDYQEYV